LCVVCVVVMERSDPSFVSCFGGGFGRASGKGRREGGREGGREGVPTRFLRERERGHRERESKSI